MPSPSPPSSSTSSATTPDSTTPPTSGVGQCWECLRRRIVCDRWQPVCNKCQTAGIVCPGYDNKKPLTWLAPGKVVSRPRKRKNPQAPAKQTKPAKPKAKQEVVRVPPPVRPEIDPMYVPHIIELDDEMIEMYEAVYYYNSYVYPDFLDCLLEPSPFIIPFQDYHLLSTSLRHILVTTCLSHRIFQFPDGCQRAVTSNLAMRLRRHRGLAIRALNAELNTEEERCSDSSISSIMLMMFADVQQNVVGNWRSHAAGLQSIFTMRGGMRQIVIDHDHMRPAMMTFIFSVVMGNTTTPSADQITSNAQKDIADFLIELAVLSFPVFPCPVPLLVEIININMLRYEVATASPPASTEDHAARGREVLDRISSFSPEEWTLTQESCQDEFFVMARLCQSAVLLYCISSLPPLFAPMSGLKRSQRTRLFLLLESAAQSKRLNRCIMWPLAVAGFLAKDGTQAERDWIYAELLGISMRMGTYAAINARIVLKKFWCSSKTEWDECFDEPHVFLS